MSRMLKGGQDDSYVSQQSINIAVGIRQENFWNKVISDFSVKNLIEDEYIDQGVYKISNRAKGFKKGDPKPKKKLKHNTAPVGDIDPKTGQPKKVQIDHFFQGSDNKKYYMESKGNLELDTEKFKVSDDKVRKLTDFLGADKGVYFVPTANTIPNDDIPQKYTKEGIEIWSVSDLLSVLIDVPFTAQDYFDFHTDKIAPFLIKYKGLVR